MSSADVVPQQLLALNKANHIRANRANLKRNLMNGTESIHDLLWDPPDFIQNMQIGDLIQAAPGYGKVKTDKLLRQCKISTSKTIERLTERQRSEISSVL